MVKPFTVAARIRRSGAQVLQKGCWLWICLLLSVAYIGTVGAVTPSSISCPQVCLILDKGGKDDHSFNESSLMGFRRAQKELCVGARSKYIEPHSDTQIEQTFRSFSASPHCDLIIAVGFNPSSYLPKIAAAYPHKSYLALDTNLDKQDTKKNIRSVSFQEPEGSFLVGYIAAMKSKTGKVGFIGGMDIPLIHRFQLGYEKGAKYFNPKIQMIQAYIGISPEAWANPVKGRELAGAQYDAGADVIFQVAAASGQGVFDEANARRRKGQHVYAIGVDSNQNWISPEVILTSMLKRIDNAVFESIKDFSQNQFTAGHIVYGLDKGGVDWALDKHNKHFYTEKEIEAINQVKKEIIRGNIKVPDYYQTMKQQ